MTVKRGATIVEIGWDNVFGKLLTAVDPDLHIEVVRSRRVSISKNDPHLCTKSIYDTLTQNQAI